MADTWAPELNLVGVVAGAPPSQLNLVYQALKTSPFKYYLLMAAAGFNAGFGDQEAPLDKVLTPAGLAAIPKVDEGCTDAISKATANVNTDDLVKADPDTVPEWAKLLDENDPGKFPAPAKEPLLIIQGGNDEQIPVVATSLMFDQLCKIHQVEQRWIYPGQSHAGVIAPSAQDMAKDDLVSKARSVVSAPVNKVTVAFPFSNIRTEEPSDALREITLIVAQLADQVAKLAPSPETDALVSQIESLLIKLG